MRTIRIRRTGDKFSHERHEITFGCARNKNKNKTWWKEYWKKQNCQERRDVEVDVKEETFEIIVNTSYRLTLVSYRYGSLIFSFFLEK